MASQQPHVVIFPFMAQGHTIPLLDLSKALSRKGLKATIITTPSNYPFIRRSTSGHTQIKVIQFEFPIIEGLPKGCENTDHLPSLDLLVPFLRATNHLRCPFEKFLLELSNARDLPICVISDFFLGWTLASCREFNVPRVVFHGMGVFSMVACKSVLVHTPHKHVSSDDHPFTVPGIPDIRLTADDLPDNIKNFDPVRDPFCRFLVEIGESDIDCWGAIVNSFAEMEGDYMPALDTFYRNGAKSWCVGPVLAYDDKHVDAEQRRGDEAPNNYSPASCIEWLDKRNPDTVLYVSFGTQTHISNAQLDEIALGLEMSGHPFIWVVRSITWTPQDGFEERVKERGLIIREWSPQRLILSHSATGGFLSHCGWNSVLESLSMGVPILAWPMIAEQHLNARFVVDKLEAGEKVPGYGPEGDQTVIGKAAVCKAVRVLMGEEKGAMLRERTRELSQAAKGAVHPGGSSDKSLDEMIKRLINHAQ